MSGHIDKLLNDLRMRINNLKDENANLLRRNRELIRKACDCRREATTAESSVVKPQSATCEMWLATDRKITNDYDTFVSLCIKYPSINRYGFWDRDCTIPHHHPIHALSPPPGQKRKVRVTVEAIEPEENQ